MADEIIKELWKIKDAMASEYDNDVRALAIHLRDQKHAGDERVDLRSTKKSSRQKTQPDPTMPS
jgi:hypothetical protein